jgi:hypothetical protein
MESSITKSYANVIKYAATNILEDHIAYEVSSEANKTGETETEKETASLSEGNDIEVFPNPTSNGLTVSWSNSQAVNHVKLMDLTGRTFLVKYVNSGEDFVNLELSQFTPGVYFVQIHCADNQILVEKVILK